MQYYIIAGEASGDLHGSNLIKELQLLDSNASFRCWGGDKMEAAGATLVKDYRELVL
jgi:lipid-A-disaccharide synthase